jgi:hypothetical protein
MNPIDSVCLFCFRANLFRFSGRSFISSFHIDSVVAYSMNSRNQHKTETDQNENWETIDVVNNHSRSDDSENTSLLAHDREVARAPLIQQTSQRSERKNKSKKEEKEGSLSHSQQISRHSPQTKRHCS